MTVKLLLFIVFLTITSDTSANKTEHVTFKNVTLSDFTKQLATISSSNNLKDYLPKTGRHVVYVTGNIPILHRNSVQDISTVTDLLFVGNGLKEIEVGAFKNLRSVKSLHINVNNLTTIKKGVFDNLEIEALDFHRCQISTIENGAFKKLPQLRSLYLGYNKMQTVKEGAFDDLISLHRLDLSYNDISTLSKGFCKNIPALKFVSLKHNKLRKIEEIFDNSTIENLDLARNMISTLPENFCDHLPHLERIIFSHNRIQIIPGGIFNNQNLSTVEIDDNEISFIDPEAFNNMPNLTTIDLSGNKLTQYNPKWFHKTPNISRLFLSRNFIEAIPDQAFNNIYNQKAQEIKLDNNKIRNLSPKTFKGLKQIHYLNLENNHIEKWNDNFLMDTEYVAHLNLQENNITCPEGNFDQIFKGQVTSLGNNPLSKDCVEEIKKWMVQNPAKKVCTYLCL